MSPVEGHRAYIITDTDQAGLIVIAAGLWMAWMVLSFATRLYTRIMITGPFSIDDLMAGIGSVGVLVTEAFMATVVSVKTLLQYAYVSDIFFMIAHSCAKISVTILLLRLGHDIRFRTYCLGVIGFLVLWTIASIFSIAMRCDKSQPWLVDASCKNVVSDLGMN
jgi:hypothetical protein